MTERAREEFLEEFQSREGTLVGFCVLGGIFSEGVSENQKVGNIKLKPGKVTHIMHILYHFIHCFVCNIHLL